MHWNSLEEALLHGHGIERRFRCHVHNDSNPSASVNSLTGKWFCYTCHAHGGLDMDSIEFDPFSMRRQVQHIQEVMERSETIYPESWLTTYDSLGPGSYWLSRFNEQTCRDHRLGQSADGSFATIPLRKSNGEIIGVIERDLTGESESKYRYPVNIKLSKLLYNYHRATSGVLVLTEGATDAIAFDEVTPGHAMAIYGNRLTRAQARLLIRYSPDRIVVATDQDKAGEVAYKTILRLIDGYCPVVRLVWDTYKDLASIPVHERADLVRYTLEDAGLRNHARVG